MKNKKDKVTLKEGEVDKPEVFQHFDDELEIYNSLRFRSGIDPYHIEPIDNPQKIEIPFINRLFSEDLLNQIKYFKPSTIVKEKTPEDVMMELKAIKMFYPDVLKRFLEEDGKENS